MMFENTIERLGGPKTLKRTLSSDLDLVRAVADGLPIEALQHVLQSGDLEPAEAYALVVSRRTLLRRKQANKNLSADQSDRLAAIVQTIIRVEDALGDKAKAYRWLRKPNRSLKGKRPIDLLRTDCGTRIVEQALGRIEHGIYI